MRFNTASNLKMSASHQPAAESRNESGDKTHDTGHQEHVMFPSEQGMPKPLTYGRAGERRDEGKPDGL
jgi:hypothetical protein